MKSIKMNLGLYYIEELKNVLKIGFVLIISAIVTLGCSRIDYVPDFDFIQGTMETKINGELIVFDYAGGSPGSFDLEYSCNELDIGIEGSMDMETPDKHSIGLDLMPSQGVGTYDNGATYYAGGSRYELATAYYKRPHLNACLDAQTDYKEEGEVTITSVDNGRYKGTFHFTAWSCDGEKVVITNGKFDVPTESELPGRICN